MVTRKRPLRQFSISEEAEAWLEIKASQGYSRSRLVDLLILKAIEEEKEKKGKKDAA